MRRYLGEDMNIEDVIHTEELNEITVTEFFPELIKSLKEDSDPYEIFEWLLDNGLKLYFSRKGYVHDDAVIEKSDIKTALNRVKRENYSETFNSVVVVVTLKNGAVAEGEKLANFFLRREDVKEIYHQKGKSEYPWPGNKGIKRSRRDIQTAKIIEVAKSKNYPLKSIPAGGKAEIRRECLLDESLFTPSGFEHAWKKVKKDGHIEIVNIEDYR